MWAKCSRSMRGSRLRKSARTVDLQQLKAMLVEKTVVARAKPAKKAVKKAAVKKTVTKKAALKKSLPPGLKPK